MYLVSRFPGIVRHRVTLPADEVLELMAFPIMVMIDNLLHFVFFFIINQFGRWALELGSGFRGFFVTG